MLASEEEEELNQQDQNDGRLKQESAAVVELLHHVLVEILGSPQFSRDEVFVVRYADFVCRQLVQARCKHIAQKLDCVVCALSELRYIEQHGVQIGGVPGEAPARNEALLLIKQVVDACREYRLAVRRNSNT